MHLSKLQQYGYHGIIQNLRRKNPTLCNFSKILKLLKWNILVWKAPTTGQSRGVEMLSAGVMIWDGKMDGEAGEDR